MIKYTDMVQSVKKTRKDTVSATRSAVHGDKKVWSSEVNILPPSKLPAGRRLRKAKKREEAINSRAGSVVLPNRQYTANAEIRFARGPHRASKISLPYEQKSISVSIAAPKMPSRIDLIGIRISFADIRWPLSCINAADIGMSIKYTFFEMARDIKNKGNEGEICIFIVVLLCFTV